MHTTVRATIGAALLAVCAAAPVGSYAHRRVNESRHYLEKVYGRGLVGMLNS